MNLLIAFHTILQNKESSGLEDAGREEEVEIAGGEESLV
jgi:hypothetical protein